MLSATKNAVALLWSIKTVKSNKTTLIIGRFVLMNDQMSTFTQESIGKFLKFNQIL